MLLAFHPFSDRVAYTSDDGKALCIGRCVSSETLRAPIAVDSQVTHLCWAPIDQALLLLAMADGRLQLISSPDRGPPLALTALTGPTSGTIKAVGWLQTTTTNQAVDWQTGNTGADEAPNAALLGAMLPLGFEGFLEVWSDGTVSLRYRRTFAARRGDQPSWCALSCAEQDPAKGPTEQVQMHMQCAHISSTGGSAGLLVATAYTDGAVRVRRVRIPATSFELEDCKALHVDDVTSISLSETATHLALRTLPTGVPELISICGDQGVIEIWQETGGGAKPSTRWERKMASCRCSAVDCASFCADGSAALLTHRDGAHSALRVSDGDVVVQPFSCSGDEDEREGDANARSSDASSRVGADKKRKRRNTEVRRPVNQPPRLSCAPVAISPNGCLGALVQPNGTILLAPILMASSVFVQPVVCCLYGRLACLSQAVETPRPWDILWACSRLPKAQAHDITTGAARQLLERLSSLEQGPVPVRLEPCEGTEPPAQTDETTSTAQEYATMRRQAQLCREGPHAYALLSGLWAARVDRRHGEAAADDVELVQRDRARSLAWRAHAALWVACQIVGDELDRWGVAEEVDVSVSQPMAAATLPSPHQKYDTEATSGKVVDGGAPSPSVMLEAGSVAATVPSTPSSAARPPSGTAVRGIATRVTPTWQDVMAHLSGGARLSKMSERRLAELYEPCRHLLLLVIAWVDLARQATALNHGEEAIFASSVTRPPPPLARLLPRTLAVLVAAHMRLGAGLNSAGGTSSGSDAAMAAAWTHERLKHFFDFLRPRLFSPASPRSMRALPSSSPASDQLGEDVAWGVASIRNQYGLTRAGSLVAPSIGGNGALESKQPASLRAFRALMEQCGFVSQP